MFRELMNFAYQRTALQALGWYLTFLLIGLLIAGIGSAIVAMTMGTTSFAEGARVVSWAGEISIIPYHIVLAIALLWSRWKAVRNIFLALLAVLLSVFVGTLGGLIPLAIVTTRPTQKTVKEIGEVFK